VFISLYEKTENVEKYEILKTYYGMHEIEVGDDVKM
jgi:hypothetical protein